MKMSETAMLDPGALTDAEYEAEIDRYINEMKQMALEMAERERRTAARSAEREDRIKIIVAETQALVAKSNVV